MLHQLHSSRRGSLDRLGRDARRRIDGVCEALGTIPILCKRMARMQTTCTSVIVRVRGPVRVGSTVEARLIQGYLTSRLHTCRVASVMCDPSASHRPRTRFDQVLERHGSGRSRIHARRTRSLQPVFASISTGNTEQYIGSTSSGSFRVSIFVSNSSTAEND